MLVDLTSPLTLVLCLAAIVCAIFLGYEVKRALAPALALILCVALLIMHATQLFAFGDFFADYKSILATSMIFDFIFILITYLAYLWIDDVEAKARNKKSIDNSLDWFWNKI